MLFAWRLLRMVRVASLPALALLATTPACGQSDAEYREQIASDMREALVVDLQHFVKAAQAVMDAAPVTQGRGWDPQQDSQAILTMRGEWTRARDLYEHVEGASSPCFHAPASRSTRAMKT